MSLEHTAAVIFPEGMIHAKEIIEIIKANCFIILARRYIRFSPEQASDFYEQLYGRRDFPLLVAYTSSAPVIVMCLGRENAVEKLVEIAGPEDILEARQGCPECLNAQFGNFECNLRAVHASKDLKAARREILFFFPNSLVEPIPDIEAGLRLLREEVNPVLKEGIAHLAKEKPAEPLLWLAEWLLSHSANRPRVADHLKRVSFPNKLL